MGLGFAVYGYNDMVRLKIRCWPAEIEDDIEFVLLSTWAAHKPTSQGWVLWFVAQFLYILFLRMTSFLPLPVRHPSKYNLSRSETEDQIPDIPLSISPQFNN